MASKPNIIDEYLAALSDDKRAVLEQLRQDIKAVAPEAEEYFYYQLPAFRLNGKRLIAFGAAKDHCSLYPLSATVINALSDDLKAYDTSPGTIRFLASNTLPKTLVRKIVKFRIAENDVKPKSNRRKHG